MDASCGKVRASLEKCVFIAGICASLARSLAGMCVSCTLGPSFRFEWWSGCDGQAHSFGDGVCHRAERRTGEQVVLSWPSTKSAFVDVKELLEVIHWRTLRTRVGVSSQCRTGQKPFHREVFTQTLTRGITVRTGLERSFRDCPGKRRVRLCRVGLAVLSSMVPWRWVR